MPRRAQDVGEDDEHDDDECHLKPDEDPPPAEELEDPLHPINSRGSAYCRGDRATRLPRGGAAGSGAARSRASAGAIVSPPGHDRHRAAAAAPRLPPALHRPGVLAPRLDGDVGGGSVPGLPAHGIVADRRAARRGGAARDPRHGVPGRCARRLVRPAAARPDRRARAGRRHGAPARQLAVGEPRLWVLFLPASPRPRSTGSSARRSIPWSRGSWRSTSCRPRARSARCG